MSQKPQEEFQKIAIVVEAHGEPRDVFGLYIQIA
jgi:hypothetical protein